MKKINLLALMVLFSVNVLTPINYVGADTPLKGVDTGLYTLNINYDADGESVDPYTIDLSEGSPYCVISPSIDGYTADRTEVSGIMGTENITENVTYAINGHNLTITYKYVNGTDAANTYTHEYKYGSSYNVRSPIIAGYTADKPEISGIMGSEDITEDVTYAINSYTLTIKYIYQNGTEAASGYTDEYEYGSSYNIPSPTIEGYAASVAVVKGTMPNRNLNISVTYVSLPSGGTIDVDDPDEPLGILSSPTILSNPINLSNSSTLLQNSSNPDESSVTVLYINLNGEKMYSDYVYIPSEREIYTIESPESDYYHADKPIIKGMMCGNDTVYTVTYRPNNDENGNGIADEEETYTVTFDLNGGKVESGVETTVKVLSGNKVQAITPTKNGYTLKGWTLNGANFDFCTPITSNITPVAQWKSNGGGSSGGGGGSSRYTKSDEPKDASDTSKFDENKNDSSENANNSSENINTLNENNNPKEEQLNHFAENKDVVPSLINVESNTDSNINENNAVYSQEFTDAYSFAKGNGITTTSSIEDAKMYGNLTRIQMAKMLSQFSINVLGKEPNTTLNNKFNDVSEDLDKQYDDGVTLSFQLGIMGQNMPNNKFRPNDEVSRAEFMAAFSRMLYGTSDGEYESTRDYYKPHMYKLYNEGIVSDTNPNMKERRGYVMIMLMRSAM